MGEKTEISWCDSTFNPWIGCTKISPGCDHCYAEEMMDKRYGRVKWGPHGERVRTSEGNWHGPVKWARKARRAMQGLCEKSARPLRPRVFCASLADVFDNQVPAEWRQDLWNLILHTPELDWLLLTKRPENIRRFLPPRWELEPDPNVWLGFTAEDQEHFDRRWPVMAQIPAVVRFCSYEPAIGPLRLWGGPDGPPQGLHWLICGGESGQGHRWMPLEWEQNVRLDCERAGIAYYFKQMAGKKPIPDGFPVVRQFPIPVSQTAQKCPSSP